MRWSLLGRDLYLRKKRHVSCTDSELGGKEEVHIIFDRQVLLAFDVLNSLKLFCFSAALTTCEQIFLVLKFLHVH